MLVVGLWVREVFGCFAYLGLMSAVPAFRFLGTQPSCVTEVLPLICQPNLFFTIIIDLMFSVIRMSWKNLNTCPLTRNIPNKTYLWQKRFVHFNDSNK